jgi:hypothetical protein
MGRVERLMWSFADGVRPAPHKSVSEDAVATRLVGDVLIAVLADGAGSATLGGEGARIAVQVAVDVLSEHAQTPQIHEMVRTVAARLQQEAKTRSVNVSDLACTLLGAVLGPSGGWVFQLGDGGIVLQDERGMRSALRAQTGEFANTTWFVTMPDAERHVQVASIPVPNAIALFSDGLQYLVLDHVREVPHEPFFHRAFGVVHSSTAGRNEGASAWIDTMLASDLVRARTDDDTSLILASRVAEAT